MQHSTTFTLSIAPMMDCTDRHFRYLVRLISPNSKLYTEMITTHAIEHGDVDYLLGFSNKEKYVALQLGGNNSIALAKAAKIGEQYGYDEINLNVGCPSGRVCAGQFGASLMLQPALVANCISAMRDAVTIPVTVKCRLGVDDLDSMQFLVDFIHKIHLAGCNTFIIHARKAWLKGLSPKQNRTIPPLNYERVMNVKKLFPHLNIILNGGIKSYAQVKEHIGFVDGVMLGREIYTNPMRLLEYEQLLFKNKNVLTRQEVLNKFMIYINEQLSSGVKLKHITRHMLGLFYGEAGAKVWRRHLSNHAYHEKAGIEVVEQAMKSAIEVK